MGYIYPDFDHHYAHVSTRRNGHFLVGVCKGKDGNRDYEKEERLRQRGLKMLAEAFQTHSKVILSDENLWHGSIKRKQDADVWQILTDHSKEYGYQIKIIIYLRRQDDLALSWINQQVKAGWSGFKELTWEKFLENPHYIRLNYYKHLEEIASIFGDEAICVRVFEPGQFVGGSIYADFIDAIGLEWNEDYVIEEERANTGLSCNGQEIKRIMNDLPDHDDETFRFVRDTMRASAGVGVKSDRYEYLSADERREFLKKYEEGNRKIAEKYLGREDGKLFREVESKKEKWTPDNPEMMEDVVRFLGEMILTQQKEINKLESKLSKVEKQLNDVKKKNEKKEEKNEGKENAGRWSRYGLFKRT